MHWHITCSALPRYSKHWQVVVSLRGQLPDIVMYHATVCTVLVLVSVAVEMLSVRTTAAALHACSKSLKFSCRKKSRKPETRNP